MASEDAKPGAHGDDNERLSQSSYLSSLRQLGPQIYLHRPDSPDEEENAVPSPSPPDLIIMCSWMSASARHIEKYTSSYVAQRRSVPILLIRSSQLDVTVRTERRQHEALEPAVEAIVSVLSSKSAKGSILNSRVLLHIFSNGGCWSACMLAATFRKRTGQNLPVTALILDSCPSLPDLLLSYRAMRSALPKNILARLLGSAVIWGALIIITIINRLRLGKNIILRIRALLNDPTGPFFGRCIPRLYICSRTDEMIPIEDVRRHAEDAKAVMRRQGLREDEVKRRVRLEEFEQSPHVGHLMVDRTRYWRIVTAVWQESMRLRSLDED